MHIHLDLIGGIAGDMFVGALLDLRPDLAAGAIEAVRQAGVGDEILLAHEPATDGVLHGSRYVVRLLDASHGHTSWRSIRQRLEDSGLTDGVKARAIDIFARLAEAEAQVHRQTIEDVVFHEVGAWDSFADNVAAAYLIETLQASWSVGPIPVGSGSVDTAHGRLPVPAPATALLLRGMVCVDDGQPGERVTPTGAAILRSLGPAFGLGAEPRILAASGQSFGTRKLPGVSNMLRVLAYEPVGTQTGVPDTVLVVSFEVDDQTPEDLAEGLDQLRSVPGVLDVANFVMVGKRGRSVSSIQILADPSSREGVIQACFVQTTTLGVRLALTERVVLRRHERQAGDGVNVKIAERPGGQTAKADLSDIETSAGHASRQQARDEAVREVTK